MSVVNFNITKPLENRVKRVIKEEGFANKAEFFRFAVMRYLEENKNGNNDDYQAFSASARKLHKLINDNTESLKNLPSLREQLADVK